MPDQVYFWLGMVTFSKTSFLMQSNQTGHLWGPLFLCGSSSHLSRQVFKQGMEDTKM